MASNGMSRAPGEGSDAPNMYPSAIAGPSHFASTSYTGPAVGNKAPAKRAAGSERGRGSGRGGRGQPPRTGGTGRGAAPLASSSVVGQRATRSVNRPHVARLKLKFSDKGEVQKVQGAKLTSFLGNYSREADSDPEEPLVFEEQFILRVPDKVVRGDKEKGIKGIKTLLEEKKEVNNASFKFKDTRRAVFNHGGTNYSAKLVDLPCIIEAQKTLDRKRLFKVADISQMLVVDPDLIESEDQVTQEALNPADYVWPHGLTPPLRHVRERRWRPHRMGDPIKAEVDRLLAKDKECKSYSFDFVESDGGGDDEYDLPPDANGEYGYREGTAESEMGKETPGTPWSQGEGLEEGSVMGEMDDRTELGSIDGDMDMDLDAALNREEDEGATDEEDEDEEEGDDDDDEAEEEEEDEEIVELRAQQRLLEQEATALEEMVSKKTQEMQNVSAMIRMRIQRDVTKYQADLATKIKARNENQSKIDARVEAKDQAREVKRVEKEGEDDYDGLFGGDDDDDDEQIGDGAHADEDDVDEDEWAEVFANDGGNPTSTPGNAETPNSQNQDLDLDGQRRSSQHGLDALDTPEHADEDEDEDDEDDEEDEDEDDEDAEGEEDDEAAQHSLGVPAPYTTPIAPPAPVAPVTAWGYNDIDSDDDDDE